ncbi:hypothetical protein J8TS2_22840 [Lederbergia ruris]|uniref:Uncharacterized protein n=1 Tax=Lederbergia ruris TaxID=217495 RepID=A0ABQ4KJ28_9BACI|nr:hypothetical protein J8TS2_22840 [Lederbergia ruris]
MAENQLSMVALIEDTTQSLAKKTEYLDRFIRSFSYFQSHTGSTVISLTFT